MNEHNLNQLLYLSGLLLISEMDMLQPRQFVCLYIYIVHVTSTSNSGSVDVISHTTIISGRHTALREDC